jgi:LPXTG-motif cell wall-anchored protein
MSQSRSLGPAAGAAATLPVTGTNTAMMVIAGVALLIVGLLLVRAARVRPGRQDQLGRA